MSIQELTAYPSIKLARLLTTLENGSRPIGGVGLVNDGVPSLGGEHIADDGKFNFENIKYVPEEFFERMSRGIIQKYDVLVVKDGATTGKTAFIGDDFPFKRAVVNEHVFIVRPGTKLLQPEYLFYFLFSEWGQAQMQREFHGGAIGGINQTFADYLEIPLPPIPEQLRIVAILHQADMLRHWRREVILKLNALLPALYDEMFNEIATDTSKQTTVGDVLLPPNGLLTGPFGTQLKVSEFVKSGNPIYGIENVLPNQFSAKVDKFITDEKFEQLNRYRVYPNDVLLTRMGTIGRACVVPLDIPPKAIISYHLFRLRPNQDICLPEFLAATFNFSPYVAHQLKNFAAGAVMAGLNGDTVRSVKIFLPGKELQKKFVNIVEQQILQVAMAAEFLTSLNMLWNSLLSRVFTGGLTAIWHETHQDELQRAAIDRDKQLRLTGEKAHRIDFAVGRVTPEEAEQFRQALQPLAIDAVQAVANFLQPNLDQFLQSLSQQYNFNAFADLALKGLPDYQNIVLETMSGAMEALSQSMRQSLAEMNRSLAESITTPFADVFSQSQEAYHLALAREFSQIAAAWFKQIEAKPPPQSDRAIHTSLGIDPLAKQVLHRAGMAPAYFRPEDLAYSEISPVQAENSLRILEALGFVRQVELEGQQVYRLVKPDTDQAIRPKGPPV